MGEGVRGMLWGKITFHCLSRNSYSRLRSKNMICFLIQGFI